MKTPIIELVEVTEAGTPEYEEINESFRAIDALLQLAVKSRTVVEPPADAEQGDRYIVPEDGVGLFENQSRRVAYLTLDGWKFRTPRNGWLAIVEDEGNAPYLYDQIEWDAFSTAGSSGGGSIDFDGNRPASGIFNLDFSAAGGYELNLLDDVVLQVTGASSGKVNRVILITRQDEIGERNFTFPAGTYWAGGAEPAVSRLPNTVHVYELATYDGGVTLYARLLAGSVYNDAGVPATYPTSIDPYWPYVSYLLHMDGNNAESVFTDEKGNTVDVVTSDLAPLTTTAIKKFGTASAEFFLSSGDSFDGLHQNHLSLPAATITDLTDVDFTIEAWVRLKSSNISSFGNIIAWKGDETTDNVLTLSALGSGLQYTAGPQLNGAINPSHLTYNMPVGGTLSATDFSHCALSRKAGIYYLALNGRVWSNGNQIASADFSQGPLTIGGGRWLGPGSPDPIPRFFGSDLYIDELQITLGVAKYAPVLPLVLDELRHYATYTPPASPFAAPTLYTPDVEKPLRPIGATWINTTEITVPVTDVCVTVMNRGKIRKVSIVTQGGPGDCSVDIWVAPITAYPPAGGDSIIGTAQPSIVAGEAYHAAVTEDSWDIDLDIDDVVCFHLDSSSDFTMITITLHVEDVK